MQGIVLATPMAVTVAAEQSFCSDQEGRAVAPVAQSDAQPVLQGVAKPGELNGWPGPRHVPDLAQDLSFGDRQRGYASADAAHAGQL